MGTVPAKDNSGNRPSTNCMSRCWSATSPSLFIRRGPCAAAMSRSVCLALLLCVLATVACSSVAAHRGHQRLPRHAPPVSNETCANARNVPPTIWSYHLHLLFHGTDKNATAQAFALRDAFIDAFQPNMTCGSLYQGEDGLCMFDPDLEPSGPFVTAQWAIFIPLEWYMRVVPWIMQRHTQVGRIDTAGPPGIDRPPFSVLVHPCSGCEYEDHSIWALWGGSQWEINMAAMTEEVPFDVIPPSDPRCQGC